MDKTRTGAAVVATVAVLLGAAGAAHGAGYTTNQGKPPDNGNCVAVFSNDGAQAGFIQDVRGGGPGAVGQQGREFGTSGGNGEAASSGCS